MGGNKLTYILKNTESSFCPKCNTRVQLLTNEKINSPIFFICFRCKYIGESGIGEVKLTIEQPSTSIE